MNERVVEIVNALIRRILHEKSQVAPEQLISELRQQGYEMAEIDAAFELIFSVPEIIKASEAGTGSNRVTTRVFTPLEAGKISVAARGFLLALKQNGFISSEEMEEVLEKAVSLRTQEVGVSEVKWLLTQVIEDEWRAYLLTYGPDSSVESEMAN